MTAHVAGRRASEVCALQGGDIADAADRKLQQGAPGHGGKDRCTLLSPHLLGDGQLSATSRYLARSKLTGKTSPLELLAPLS